MSLKKKDINALFKNIRNRNNEDAKELLSQIPELVNSCRKAPPKKDDGQSPLQVAFKTGNFEIADYLIDLGAYINFIDSSEINEWNMPVLHDALRAAVFTSTHKGYRKQDFESALRLLNKLLNLGANPNTEDSYENTPTVRALLDSRQVINSDPSFPESISDSELEAALRQVFFELYKAGADFKDAVSRLDWVGVEKETALLGLLEGHS